MVKQSKTSKWLAKELGKSESTVSRWCTNEIQPSVEALAEIAELLKIDIKRIVEFNQIKNEFNTRRD